MREAIVEVDDLIIYRTDGISTGGVRESVLLPSKSVKGELIRCKDCKFNEKGYCLNETLHFHLEPLEFDGGALFETRPDFYCAYGKRREE